MFTYSIIIPHKNIPDLLNKCIYSIPERNDIQIIIIDDNSEDSTFDLSLFGNRHIEIYKLSKSKGAGGARNEGLLYVKGKWLLFADADDFYLDGAFDILDLYSETSYEIIYFNVNSFTIETMQPSFRANHINKFIDDAILQKNDMNIRFKSWEVWNKMYSTNFILENALKFEETKRGNDILFGLLSSYFADKYRIIPNKLYCITFREDSLSTMQHSYASLLEGWKSYIKICSFYNLVKLPLKTSPLRILGQVVKQIFRQVSLITFIKFISELFFNFQKYQIYKMECDDYLLKFLNHR